MKFFNFGFVVLFAGVLSHNSFAADDTAAPLVLQAFQNSCMSVGSWTQAATKQNRAMAGVIQTLKDNDPCKPFAGKLAVIENASAQIGQLLTDQNFTDYRVAEEKLQNLMLALNAAPTPEVISALGEQIVSTQVSLAEKRAKYQVGKDQTGKDQYEKATLGLTQYVQGLLTESGGLASCLHSSPSAAVQLATNLTSFGGSFVSPIYGAGAAIIGQILNTAVEYFRVNGREKALYKLHSALFPAALTCGLESMTELYCQANDAFSLLDLQLNNPLPGTTVHPVWADLDVIRRQLPVLNDWLLQVRNGVTPANPTEAERQNEIWKKIWLLQDQNRSVEGQLNYLEQLYSSTQGATEKLNLLISFVVRLDETLLRHQIPTPFMDLTSDFYTMACYLSQGMTGTCPPHGQESTEAYVRDKLGGKLTGVQKLIDNWVEVFGAVEKQVNTEFNQTIALDPSSILASASEVSKEKISPVTATQKTIVFLERLRSTTASTQIDRINLINETLKILNQFLAVIQGSASTSKDKIREVFALFQLNVSSKLFYDRISKLVQWDLTDMLLSGNYPQDAKEILLSGAADVRTRLQAAGVSKDLVEGDLNQARVQASANMDVFNSFFETSMGNTLKDLSDKAKLANEPSTGPDRPYGQSLARLCVLNLITHNQWPKDIPWALCQDAVLYSIFETAAAPLRIVLKDLKVAVAKMPAMERYCQYHKFIRAGRIAEIMEGPTKAPLYLRRNYRAEPFDFNKLLKL